MPKTERLKLRLRHLDYLHQVLEFDWPGGVRADRLSATVTVTQPYGFEQKLTSQALRRDGRGEVEIVYPLIDDGRFRPVRKFGPWKMGRYRFELNLKAGRRVVGRGALNVDPNDFFGEIGGQKLAQVDSLRQFIECCTERAVFIDHEEVGFTIRTIPERVKTCTVEVDVVRAKDGVRKAGPIRLNLDRKIKKKRFDGAGWSPGEYWLRVRAIRNAQPAGPYMVRQFWMERPFRPKEPELPQRPGDRPQLLVDGWIFSSSKGLRHEPDQLERLSDGPVFELDRPWEVGPRGAGISSFSWDEEAKQFRVTYTSGPIPDDPRLWKIGVASGLTQFSTRYICLAVSGDGVHWEKPELGIVEYNGSKRNNILRDTAGEGYLLSGEYDSYPVPVKERPLPRKYRYRFYDAKRDGPVDMDNFAFRVFMERSWEPDDQREGGFRPQDRTFYGMERRGDLFLVLTRRPVLLGGRGIEPAPHDGAGVHLSLRGGTGGPLQDGRRRIHVELLPQEIKDVLLLLPAGLPALSAERAALLPLAPEYRCPPHARGPVDAGRLQLGAAAHGGPGRIRRPGNDPLRVRTSGPVGTSRDGSGGTA